MFEMIALVFFALFLLFALLFLRSQAKLREAIGGKQSLSVKYGKMSEQFFPFMKDYPYDPRNFRFLGTPVDGIQFEEDGIIFVEFKSGSSQLSEKQKKIKELAEKKRIRFEEMRIE